ncbi:MAG TPA: TIGR03620 family F420-dependent LLM class oxidoreductase [Actinomycetota bacterium]
MTAAHDSLRARLGRIGAWTFAFDARSPAQIAIDARGIESLGYGALWIPEGGGSNDVLTNLSWLLAATERLTVASGIANISAREPEVLARGADFLTEAYDGRLVLGVGVGHEYTTERRGMDWSKPLERMARYLEVMDEAAGDRPRAPRLLAALGDRMLRLSAERALGAHTYFVPPAHTARAREVLGPDAVLAVEQGVILGADAEEARRVGRAWCAGYLELPNYARNWARLGYDDDVEGPTDRLVDAAIAWGDVDTIVARVRDHLDAGADHVCIQPILDDESDVAMPWFRELAPRLFDR